MVELTSQVVNEIRKADGEAEIKTAIDRSIEELRNKRRYSGKSNRNFLINTIMALRYSKSEQLIPESQLPNIDKGIDIFEKIFKSEDAKFF